MKKVLIISYYWPPAGGPGVQRILKFSKYLPENGWQPIIIAPENGTYPAIDTTMLEEIPESCIVYRTKTLEPFTLYNTLKGNKNKKEMSVGMIGLQDKSRVQKLSNYVRANYFIPDARKYWKRYVLKAVKVIMKEHKIDAFITTGPPHSTHLAGLEIKRKYKLPWVADFRDPWTNIYYNNMLPRTAKTKTKDAALETKVVQSCDAMIVATEGLKREFEDRKNDIQVILNGFDQSDIIPLKLKKQEKFTLAYIGNFKPNQNVKALWDVLEELNAKGVIHSNNFCLKLTGKADQSITQRLTEGPLRQLTEIEGYVPHKVATQRMQEASLLMFIIPQDKNNGLILTGKLFEYLASRTPLLSIGPVNGDADKVLQLAGRSGIIDYSDTKAMTSRIQHFIETWQKQKKIPYRHETDDALLQFSRQEQTHKLASLLHKITST
jgi:glycosyltransferase involved in cell wall biosynthesis